MGFALLLQSDAPSIDKKMTMKGLLLVKKNKEKIFTYLELCTRQSCPVHINLLQRLIPPIFTLTSLQYFSSCFFLAFLESCFLFSSPEVISLYLVPATWKSSMLSKRAVSSTSILSQSCQRYSNIFFFFFSSTFLYFSASSLILASAVFLTF